MLSPLRRRLLKTHNGAIPTLNLFEQPAMNRTILRAFLAIFIAVAAVSHTSVAVAADKPATAQFRKVYGQWKELLIKIRHLRNQYQAGSASERARIVPEYRKLVAQGYAMAPKVVAAAEKAYLEAPNKDFEISDFLLAETADNVSSDRYPEAFRRGEMMIKHGYNNPAIYNFAGVAAFGMHDFKKANDYLSKAFKTAHVDQLGKTLAPEAKAHQAFWEEEQKIRAAEAKADDLPRVKLETSQGDIVVELFENEAPIATANFINLVEKGYYNGLKFHRVIPNFMAQGGDDEQGGPGYSIPDECRQPNARRHFSGSLSMAKTPAPDSGGSQFFLTFRPTPHLNGLHTVFGRVIEGMDVLPKIQRIEPGKEGEPDRIVRAEVLRKRKHKYEPTKLPARSE